MNKKTRKLSLNRDTLHFLDRSQLAGITGGERRTVALACQSANPGCSGFCESAESCSPTLLNTCGVCSNGCATGGACTL